MDSFRNKMFRAQIDLQQGATDRLEKASALDEEGSTTVEYAIGAVATAAFAGLLLAVLKSAGIKALITGVISSALSI